MNIIDSDETGEEISDSELSSDHHVKKPVKPKKKTPVKRVAKAPRNPTKKRKQSNEQAEALKSLLCEWSQEGDCMKRILDGKKIALVPVFI